MGFEQALELRVTQNLITRLKRSALRLILEGSHYCKIDFLAQFFAVITHCAEWDLNKIEKTFNGTFVG